MSGREKIFSLVLAAVLLGASGFLSSDVLAAGIPTPERNLTELGGIGGNSQDWGLETELGSVIGRVIAGILALAGTIFLLLMVYAGYLWMTASGNSEQMEKAQKIVTTGITGIVVTLAAYAITIFVGGSLGAGAPQ